MSSEQGATTPGPGQGSRAARRPQAGQVGAAELARSGGYQPDDPATWPGNRPGAESVPAAAPASAAAPGDGSEMVLTDAKAMRALAHPLRMSIIELLSVQETLTATQASEALGESPANCAFHLRTLAKYGYVREAGGGRGRERPWTRVSRSLLLSTAQPDAQAALAAGELSSLWLERWMDRARRTFGSTGQVPGWEKASGWSNRHVFLTPEETAELQAEMCRLLDRYGDRRYNPALRPEGALPVEWTTFVSPSPELAGPDRARSDDLRPVSSRQDSAP